MLAALAFSNGLSSSFLLRGHYRIHLVNYNREYPPEIRIDVGLMLVVPVPLCKAKNNSQPLSLRTFIYFKS